MAELFESGGWSGGSGGGALFGFGGVGADAGFPDCAGCDDTQ